ncbi:MAG: hypothetical protein IPN53_02630 [Comamonadaceae bacterium]|nr:hypothetical protein [Comamonadaceae bacterium]
MMDKQGVGMDMWTSLQNAQLDHIPTPPTRALTHKSSAFGLTRFACQTAFKNEFKNTEKPEDLGFGQNRGNAVQLYMKTGIA